MVVVVVVRREAFGVEVGRCGTVYRSVMLFFWGWRGRDRTDGLNWATLKSEGRRGLGNGLMLVYCVFVLVVVFVFVGLSLFLRIALESGDSGLLFWYSIALLNLIVFSCTVECPSQDVGSGKGHVKRSLQCGPSPRPSKFIGWTCSLYSCLIGACLRSIFLCHVWFTTY